MISCRHVFESFQNNQDVEINIFRNDDWDTFGCRAHVYENEDVDLIVFSYDGTIGGTDALE